MTELKDAEEKIAQMREFYNENALRYNNTIQTFPGNIIAYFLKIKRKEYLSFSLEREPQETNDRNIYKS
ncbi:MAG: LemA family protein [Candidatus Methanomethylicaceae archaeon]